MAFLLCARCQVYDEALLKDGDAQSAQSPQAVESPMQPGSTDGSGDQPDGAEGARIQVSPPEPPGSQTTRCGDGIISGVEKCDTAIEGSESGACPTACPALAACAPRALNGTACQAACVLIEPSCKGGDGCCPSSCNPGNDSDCSNACGDGKIDTELGETCEPSIHACETDDKECADSDPCTLDRLLGSPKNCNSFCTHAPITERVAGDGCCPNGADNSLDRDCAPKCGNGVREKGEDCDGEDGCSSDCKSPTLAAEGRCVELFGSDDCKKCLCMECTEQALACWDTEDKNINQLCSAITDCSNRTQCVDNDCFCAANSVLCVASGPCVDEIANAAGSREPLIVNTSAVDSNSKVGRAKSVVECRVRNCRDACAPKSE